jgi:hypothetical protein
MKKELDLMIGKNKSFLLKLSFGTIPFTLTLLKDILEVKENEEFKLILEKIEKK